MRWPKAGNVVTGKRTRDETNKQNLNKMPK